MNQSLSRQETHRHIKEKDDIPQPAWAFLFTLAGERTTTCPDTRTKKLLAVGSNDDANPSIAR